VPTINGKFRPEFLVIPGERIRLRLINGANARIFSPQIEGLIFAVENRFTRKSFKLASMEDLYLFPPP
jgi:FtsP/CotA-like multicopper oxidase with cupredoxin domain